MNLMEFQRWLNARGASIAADGKPGPQTRAAILSVFANRNANAANAADIVMIADMLGGTVKQVNAVAKVESSGGGFLPSGHPKALYERHYFWKRVRIKIPLLSDPVPGGYTLDADRDGINDSWEKIADAAMRNPIAAFESASFGKFQIMGAWAQKLGYQNAIEFAYALSRDEVSHYRALAAYIINFGGVEKFRALSGNPAACRPFAEFYNGPKQKGYDQRLAQAMQS